MIFRFLKNNPAIRWVISISVIIILIIQLQNELLHSQFNFSAALFHPLTALAVALLPFNYFLETYKWRLLINPFYPKIPFFTCLKAVLVGTSLGLFTPNRVGEYVGRLGTLYPKHRYEAATATLINRLTQLIATSFFGVVGLIYFFCNYQQSTLPENPYTKIYIVILVMVLIVAVGCIMVFQKITWKTVIRIIKSKSYLRLFLKYLPFIIRLLKGAVRIPRKVIIISVLLAFIRYFIFSTQYVLLLFSFGISLHPVLSYALVSIIFLLKSFIPSLALAELGIREALAIYVFSLVKVSALPVVQATFILYVLNLFLPALFGTFVMPQWIKNG